MLSYLLPFLLSTPHSGVDAYLDPGSGSYILQILIAALLGSMFFLRSFWAKVLNFFRKGSGDADAPADQPAQTDTTPPDETQNP